MQVDPPLFSRPIASTAPPAPKVSQARLAFEAMLSANAQRHVITPIKQAILSAASVKQTVPENTSNELVSIARPGRVIDIKV